MPVPTSNEAIDKFVGKDVRFHTSYKVVPIRVEKSEYPMVTGTGIDDTYSYPGSLSFPVSVDLRDVTEIEVHHVSKTRTGFFVGGLAACAAIFIGLLSNVAD